MAPSKVSANSLLDLLCTHVKWKRSGAGHTAAVPKMAQCLDSLIWLNLTTKLQFYLSMIGKKVAKRWKRSILKDWCILFCLASPDKNHFVLKAVRMS